MPSPKAKNFKHRVKNVFKCALVLNSEWSEISFPYLQERYYFVFVLMCVNPNECNLLSFEVSTFDGMFLKRFGICLHLISTK